ncbi:hypothetical protein Pmar_PMAR028146 [Perkinsus marinus ATCC 50983]|uniref:Uncharacterized protein n=1 Tax=Perkinsus marinus (strain ATCC 50983 / TXsc) TaxID=423536 RepID=C5LB33_PERM5|nr:hypothetical protein Pmar_PMAR028146 [Perkinsus marinus ATCC 50983]EER05961.1 hypothetical protein Pmar_PMAR028146 [Perkinsus marinus ATCC 50983]|eukprot:XP_002774145.1 hypothetical protein Pmar_PMAR028146 [Perkinsus marinus ATCC 50983]
MRASAVEFGREISIIILQVITGAQFLRRRLYASKSYSQDSVITPDAAREIAELCIHIGDAETLEELIGIAPDMFEY